MIALLNCAIKMKLRLRFPANQVILMCGCPVLLVHHNCQQSWAETYSTSYYIYYYSSLILSLKLNMRSNESPRVPFVFWGMNLRSSQAKTNAKNANETLVKGTNRLREGHSLELIDDDDKKKKEEILFTALALTFGVVVNRENSGQRRASTNRFLFLLWWPAPFTPAPCCVSSISIPWFCPATAHNAHWALNEIYPKMMNEQIKYSNFVLKTNKADNVLAARGYAALNMHTAAQRGRYQTVFLFFCFSPCLCAFVHSVWLRSEWVSEGMRIFP